MPSDNAAATTQYPLSQPVKFIIKPLPLKPGGTIGVVSPAGPSFGHAMAEGVQLLESWGYRVKVFPHALRHWGYLSGTDEQRLSDLVSAFTDPDVDLVLAARGGFGCTRLLPHIPWETLRPHPKLLVGFSDLTALLLPFYDRLGWVGLHGPMLTSNLIEKDEFSATCLQAMWSGGYLTETVDLLALQPDGGQPRRGVHWLHGHSMTGRLTGGNLSLLAALCGTPWQPNTVDHVVFIEDWNESFYSIDRQFQQMKQAGLFSRCNGLILGDFCNIRSDADWSIAEHWKMLTADLNIPVAIGLAAGHGDVNTTLPIGVTVRL